MSALNAAAPLNVEGRFDTEATFHLPMSALKATALLNVKQYRVAGQIAQGLAESNP
jgi:hypothetical protein